MPAPGDQHNGRAIANPFEEVKPRISEYTAQEIATLQSRLEKQLGPEYISSRSGPSGQKVHYITAEKCIQLANEVFGFNGWSSQIIETQVDFVDENATTFKVSLGLSVIVRVTLKDGTFHEDVGYGHIENCKGKAAAFEKAKKEGTTDGLKRALRNFGNVLGNCIYDKDYLSKVTKIKVQPVKWDVENLHRHSTFTPQVVAKKEIETSKMAEKTQAQGSGPAITSPLGDDTLIGDDEFGDFDDADFNVDDPNSHPDEVALPPPRTGSHHFNNVRNSTNAPLTNTGVPNQSRTSGPPVPPVNRGPLIQPNRPPEAGNQNIIRNNHPPPAPRTPNAGLSRSISAAGLNAHAPQDLVQPNRPVNLVTTVPGRVLNQPNRPQPEPASGPPSPPRNNDITDEMPPPGAGFFSARVADLLHQDHPPSEIPPVNLKIPAFNPNLESPSIRRTPGIDQKSSKPLSRDLKSVPSSQAPAPTTGIPPQAQPASRPVIASNRNINLGNPQLDATRRIGAPSSPSPMNMGNRNSYKPPTMKRPMGEANRVPLTDLRTNGNGLAGDAHAGGDAKRQRLNGM
ncbi:38355255-20e3-48ff-a51b-a3e1fbaa28d9 [Sclerotinia trifoliorum]|uniref:RAD52 homolog n=1 Tax=Sclerotinia trifoliorum TaxID=28548 RepID=A0A8H2VVJ6_9HELO|nr:38355255-20e3-48ff-a51b-a3e1fbaa28d9 [Sclerotinia trifoliorum]